MELLQLQAKSMDSDVEAHYQEAQRLEAERLEAGRLEAQRLEQLRLEAGAPPDLATRADGG